MGKKSKNQEQPMPFEEAMKRIVGATKEEVEKKIKEKSKREKPSQNK